MKLFYIKTFILSVLFLNANSFVGQTHVLWPNCPDHKPVTVKLYNVSDYDIDSLHFEGAIIPTFIKGSMKEIVLDYYCSFGFPTGKIKNLNLFDPNKGMLCGTGAKWYCNTTLSVEIRVNKNEEGFYITKKLRK